MRVAATLMTSSSTVGSIEPGRRVPPQKVYGRDYTAKALTCRASCALAGGGTPDPGNAMFCDGLHLRLEAAMVVISSSSFTVPDRHPVLGRPNPELVVWLRGQHNGSNGRALCLTLARAIALGSPG